MVGIKLDKKDLEILRLIQEDYKKSIKNIAMKVNSPMTTVYTKIKRMEELGIIKGYKAILDPKKLDRGTIAFILVRFSYTTPQIQEPLSQRDIVKKMSVFPEVQETHIVSGDFDIIVKVKVKDVDEMGKFITDKLRKVEGVERTISCVVFETLKETTDIYF
jgi:DNA-binding Lrp family transcriptional regulator